ncbi:LANO_0H18536g1_1 [Lachancea nothofagi CBS 11611]|uniref:Elongator complex protein 1 n=1 Tax=Lachancea nothofagi CBS 11611 TaxID=1266666 RepID=A0A1G4KNC7_9SACH|nr:LANO_0H18536g1_1 [Lachancea nothofagi CBS 11611]
MRNLITLNRGRFRPVSTQIPDLKLYASVFDTLSDSITCATGDLQIGALEVHQYMKDGSCNVLASFNIQTFDDELLSFAHFADLSQLVFVMAQGDIVTATYDPISFDLSVSMVEIVGSIDGGIAAAEWSCDEETLALATMERNIVLLSRQFEPITEYKLASDDLRMSKHVNVGWGKKETQFRGKGARAMEREALESLKASGLKGNELRDPTMPYVVDSGELGAMDSGRTSISWRGDCEYFVVSAIEDIAEENEERLHRRALRVFSREGQLDSASEPVDGQEDLLSWKPQGSLIASIQRKDRVPGEEAINLIFFERNGLRHGEFDTRLPLEDKVKFLSWNSNSEVLAIVLSNKIMLWTTKNYHWYLKQEIYAQDIKFVRWHPEKDFTLMFGDENCVNIVDFAYKLALGPTLGPCDSGTVLVIDGCTLNISPLGIANVPPPMYYRDFEAPDAVLDAATSLSNELYIVTTKEELILAGVPSLEDMKRGLHPCTSSSIPKSLFATEYDNLRQVAFINDNVVGVLLDANNLSRIALIDVTDVQQPSLLSIVETMNKVVLLRSGFEYNYMVYETKDSRVFQLDQEGQITEIVKFPQLVRDIRVKRLENSTGANASGIIEDSELVAFGLAANGKLYANDVLLTSTVTSMEITDKFLMFTTAQHNLQFVHLNSTNFKPLPVVLENVDDERIRAIERGSLLVTAIPSKSSVVLQAARGNLEVICPRIMVLAGIREDILAKRYHDALVTCRTHRIHLDILHDYAPELFIENLKHFIDDIERGDYLDLFISCLMEEDVAATKYRETLGITMDQSFETTPQPLTEMENYMKKKMFDPKKSKVNKICNALLEIFMSDAEYKNKYLQSIITAYACQNPPNLEEVLILIPSLDEDDKKESCLTYLCFLHDVNVLYKVALSLYDVKLTLAFAQKSQMDPREYLPFLQSLHEQEPLMRKFVIDDHLKRYEKALNHLSEVEKDSNGLSDNIIDYIQGHDLYQYALALFRYEAEKQNAVYNVFAPHLSSKQEYGEAAIIHEMLGQFELALEAYTLGKKWNEALTLASLYFREKIPEVAEQLVSALSFDHKYADAAEIELNFLSNTKEAMQLYCKAFFFEKAALVGATHGSPQLIDEVLGPALGDGFGTVAELIADCKGQVTSQLKRLRELRQKKDEDPYAFYGEETEQADDISIAASETSTKESFFTRYTGKTGGTAKTGASRRTAKNKRREERKRARGKKGTIYEEEYLVQSIGRLIDRLTQTQADAVKLIEALLRRGRKEEAHQIQKHYDEVMNMLKEHVIEIYTISEKDRERIDEEGNVYHVPVIPVPTIKDFATRHIIDF